MKCIFSLIFYLFFVVVSGFSQKPSLEPSDFGNWALTSRPYMLTADGKFVAYYVMNKPKGENVLVVKSVDSKWENQFSNVVNPQFLSNSKVLVGEAGGKSLLIVNLGTSRYTRLDVDKFKILKANGEELLACFNLKKGGGSLAIYNIDNLENIVYSNVTDFVCSGDSTRIIMKRRENDSVYSVVDVDLKSKKEKVIYSGLEPLNLVVDNKGKRILFVTVDAHRGDKDIWYYNAGESKLPFKLDYRLEADSCLKLGSFDRFGSEGAYVFCNLVDKAVPKREEERSNVLIWSYASSWLRGDEEKASASKERYGAILYLKSKRIIQVQEKGEKGFAPLANGNFLLLNKVEGDRGEWNWNEKAIPSRILLDLSNGTRTRVTMPNDRNAFSYVLSPMGKFIIYYDADSCDYYVFDVYTHKRRNITKGVSAVWTTYNNDDIPFAKYMNLGLGGFNKNETTLYLYDQYDIFRVDLTGAQDPVNLTNGYGRKNGIVFRFAFDPTKWEGDRVILTAFNRITKQDGFFEVHQSNPGSLKALTMQSATFTGPEESKYSLRAMPVKAMDSSVYLVQRMTSEEAPNLYVTRDFVNFLPVSDEHPERKVNWITTELINFETVDGKKASGILYRPENFDPQKKYPLIFYYYEKISECLNFFIPPAASEGPINIPYFVSNGYLVFTPDIHFEIGYPGRSSLNTIMGAANKLVQFPYVDSTRLGLQGHSFGSFQTNYIVTHTNRFAAACTASGFSDYISAYGSVIGRGYTRQGQYELYRDRIGANLWDRPDLYIENSPVFSIDKVQTPVLIMHNSEDDNVPFGQGLEFYTGLRRLGKVAYLLQYKDGDHGVYGDAAVDYTRRMLEFFDYYLKGKELPSWMTNKTVKVLKL